MLHSSAFGVYLFSEVLSCVSFALYEIKREKFDSFNDVMTLIWFGLSILAQGLLCIIFWELGEAVHVEYQDTAENESIVSLDVQGFDDQAQIQARIWNQFNKQ